MATLKGLFRRASGPQRPRWLAATAVLALVATSAGADQLSVRIQTDRGTEAVYQSGDPIHITINTNQDANLLVYEIDAEGAVNLLFPTEDGNTNVKGGSPLDLPRDAQDELVVEGPVGEGYVVAIASESPFVALPWYLRPRNAQADELGYTGAGADTLGVTPDGKIVGDPFVAMERIRRQVLADPSDTHTFATAYTTYYLHEQVNYPRYLCYDCHRPDQYAWWDGFDPYYTTCSVFEFRVNANWWWGPTYWCGYVPYFAYVYRPTCPPAYLPYGNAHPVYSSWDGWTRWNRLWGGPLHRVKSTPPATYVGPTDWKRSWTGRGGETPLPPGYMASAHRRWGNDPGATGGIRRGTREGQPTAGSVAGDANRGSIRWNRGGARGATPPESDRATARKYWTRGGNRGSGGEQQSGRNPAWADGGRAHWGDGSGRWQDRGGSSPDTRSGDNPRQARPLPDRQDTPAPAEQSRQSNWGAGRARMRAPESSGRGNQSPPARTEPPQSGSTPSWGSAGSAWSGAQGRGWGTPRSGRP